MVIMVRPSEAGLVADDMALSRCKYFRTIYKTIGAAHGNVGVLCPARILHRKKSDANTCPGLSTARFQMTAATAPAMPAPAATRKPFQIRDARPGDVPAIQAIYAHHVLHGRASFEEVPPSVDDMHVRFAEVLRKGLPYIVAERDGDVLGYAYASSYRARSAYRFAIEDSIYIHHRRVGEGLGQALLGELIARCETGPWRQMVAVVACTASGEGAGSLAVHERLGFRTIGRLEAVGFKHGQWMDTVLMQRPLGVGAQTLPE
jgi:L-amino acid N-acyltransferase YncA